MARARTRNTSVASPGELGSVMTQYQERYGANVMSMAGHARHFTHLPTGIFTLDMALLGGIPEGLTTLVYGHESSGKTTLCQRVIAQAQRKYPDKRPVLIDVEGTYDPVWGGVHGIDNDNMVLAQPQSGEQALDIADSVLRAEETSVVVVDSLAALVPVKELEDSLADAHVGLAGKLIAAFTRKVQHALIDERSRGHTPTLILVNQWRTKIGVFRGDPRVLPGGRAQHFLASVKLEIMNKEHLGKDDREFEVVDHNDHSFKIAKNKTGNSMRSGEFMMVRNPDHPLGAGFIDDARVVATWAKKMGVITGGGSSWRIDGVEERFRTLDSIAEHFYSDLEWYHTFQRRLVSMHREAMGLRPDGW